MLYINYVFVYSILGFIMESTLYKITASNIHSGIFYGPYTFVYGVGVLISIIVYQYLRKKIHFKKKLLEVLFYFLLFTVLLSFIEFIGGHLLHFVFQTDLWNYQTHKDALGKYVCLTNSLIWGCLGTFNIYLVYPKLKKILKKLPVLYTYSALIIFFIDFTITIINKVVLK